MKTSKSKAPTFRSESEEADWWASAEGRRTVKSAVRKRVGALQQGSKLVAALSRPATVQIALRLPERDLTHARELAERKGIGYQTLLKMIVHEGLVREERRSAA